MAFTGIGFDGPLTEPNFGTGVPNWGTANMGVVGANDWVVTAHPSTPGGLNVSKGGGWCHGVTALSTAVEPITQASLPAAGQSRWDLLALRYDWQPPGGTVTLALVQGTAVEQIPGAATSAGGAGRQVFPGVVYDEPLALVQWVGGQSQPAQIRDLRTWSGTGGTIAKSDLVRSFLDALGTKLLINGSEWNLTLGLNDAPTWVPTQQILPVAVTIKTGTVTYWTVSGTVTLTRSGGLTRVDVDVQIRRVGPTATIPYDPATSLSAVIPVEARKNGLPAKILTVRFTGAGSTVEAAALLTIANGTLTLRGEANGSLIRQEQEGTLQCSYFI